MVAEQRRKAADGPPCPRCKASMLEIVTISPTLAEQGLIAYECPACGYLMSEIQPALGQQRG